MSRTQSALSLLAGLALAASLGGTTAMAGSEDAAHSLADKFARDTQRKKPVKPAVAEPRNEPSPLETADTERRILEQRRLEQRRADEAEMLARARAEAEEARLAEAERARRAEIEAAQRATSAIADPTPVAAPEPADIGAAPKETAEELEARRQAESDAVAARLRRTRETLAAAKAAAAKAAEHEQTMQSLPAPAAAVEAAASRPANDRHAPLSVAAEEPSPVAPPSPRVTVLLAIDHGSKGIRRFDTTGDPILCIDEDCFVGAGADRPAARLPRRRALGVGNTLGKRAGACSNSLGCVLRDVDLGGYPRVLRPVDLRVMHHDRRDPVQVKGDSDCSLRSGQLSCRFAVRGRDWRAWIVPEALAATAGPRRLQSALEDGLGATRTFARR